MREFRSVVVAFLVLHSTSMVTLAGPPAEDTGERPMALAIVPASAAFDPYSVVSVCPFNGSWWVMWHTPAGVDVEKATRARNQLESLEFTECLARMVWTDPATRQIVESAIRSIDRSKQTTKMDLAAADASIVAVRKRWTEFGVREAITEAAETNARGERVARVMAACEKLAAAENAKPK